MLIKGYAKISCLSTRIPGEREMKKKKPLNPRKKPVQKRSQETVAAILEAAAQVFSRNGYAATTTDRIARRAGVSIGSLYQYFPNKDAILLGLVERHIEESQSFVTEKREEIEGAGQVGPEMIGSLVEAAIALHSLDPALHRVLFEEAPRTRATIRRIKETEDATVGMVATLLGDNPGIRLQNAPVGARMIFTTIEVLTHWYVLYGNKEIDQEDFVNELTDMLNRYTFL